MKKNKKFLRLLICSRIFLTLVAGKREIVFVSLHSPTSLPYSLDYIGPAIDLGVRDLNHLYDPHYHFKVDSMNKSYARSCLDIEKEALPFLAGYFWKKGRSDDALVVVAPGKFSVIDQPILQSPDVPSGEVEMLNCFNGLRSEKKRCVCLDNRAKRALSLSTKGLRQADYCLENPRYDEV